MPVKMQPDSVIKARLGIEPNGRVQRAFTHSCRLHMNKYIPEDKGNLKRIVDEQPDKIIYESNYARYQYYGVREDGTHQVKKYTTPGTGTYWDKRMWSAEKKQVIDEVQKTIGGK